ncbi:MAG: DUF4197 domain-containing protein [Verrucomicrobia bacterium]|nr:DUF4197 domain-containing protein [Verrucomicrobiota bacterium]
MKNKISMWLAVAGLLALAAGCGKTETAVPPAKETANPTSVAKPEPTMPVEKLVAQTTNADATTTDAAKTAPDTAVKATNTVVTPVKEVAPPVVAATNPAPDKPQAVVSQAQTALTGLSQDQMVQGLKDALARGLQQAIAGLGHDGGFLTNVNVKIPMPEKLQTVDKALRAMKQEKLADDFVTTMNHAAEQAVPEAGTVFADALKQMTIEDAKAILSGPNDAATLYFQKTTQTNLYTRFYPIVQKATEQTGVTAAYKNLMAKANVGQGLGSFGSALGGTLLGKDTLDIDAYVTNKALDGLFKMVAAEEHQIRQNPVARTTDMLQKVFGALKK